MEKGVELVPDDSSRDISKNRPVEGRDLKEDVEMVMDCAVGVFKVTPVLEPLATHTEQHRELVRSISFASHDGCCSLPRV